MRLQSTRGDNHHRTKWPDAVVLAIFLDYRTHAMLPVEIARARGVPYQTVKNIVYRRRRATVTMQAVPHGG